MQLALQCRTDLLEAIQSFADFDFVLANLMLSDEVYAEYYKASNRVKMLDNGVTETGEPESLESIEKIAKDINATYIIARDWIGDFEKTVRGYHESVEAFGVDKVLGVVQGATLEDAVQCLYHYINSPIVLVPYHVGGSNRRKDSWLMAHKRALIVSNIPSDVNVHLLGFTTTSELFWYRGKTNILSIDTDVPVKAGLALQDTDDYDRSVDITDVTLDYARWAAVCRNLALLRKAMS